MPQEPWIERLVRYQYLEPLLVDRRVLEVGCGTGRGAELVAGFARSVHALETSSLVLGHARHANARPNLHFAVGEPDRLDFAPHSFDVILVPELQRWMTRGPLLPELGRVLDPTGFCVFGVPSADAGAAHGLSYPDFFEFISQGFPSVQIFGEIPFLGTTMAAFEPQGEIEPILECSLVQEDELPRSYLALCSHKDLPDAGYAVVQMPQSSLGAWAAGPALSSGPGPDRGELPLELDRLRQRLTQAESRAEDWATSAQTATADLVAKEAETERLQVQVQQLQSELSVAKAGVGILEQFEEATAERDDLRRRVAELRRRPEAQPVSEDTSELRLRLAEAERRALGEANRARTEMAQLRRDLGLQSERARQAGEDLVALRKALAEARALLAEGAVDAESLAKARPERRTSPERRATAPDPQRERLESDYKQLEARNAALEASATEAQHEIGKLQAQLTAAIDGASADAIEVQDIFESEPFRRWSKDLHEQLKEERRRADEAQARREEATEALALAQAQVEMERARARNAEQTVGEMRETTRQQRERVQSSQQRADGLVATVDQGAAELSRLHQRIAELQGVRQADRWRIDELTGRLRASEAKTPEADLSRLSELDAEVQRLRQRIADDPSPALRRQVDEQAKHIAQMALRLAELSSAEPSPREFSDKDDTATQPGVSVWRRDDSVLRGDLSRAMARQAILEGRVDRLLAELAAVYERGFTGKRTRAITVAGPAGDGVGEGLAQVATRVGEGDGAVKSPKGVGDDRGAAQGTAEVRRELRDTRLELGLLREELAQERARPTPPSDEPWEGEELLRVRERQIDALMEGAAAHKAEAEHLRDRLIELEQLATEEGQARQETVRELERVQAALGEAQQRADTYRVELVAQGRQLAQVQGEVLRLRRGSQEPDAASGSGVR